MKKLIGCVLAALFVMAMAGSAAQAQAKKPAAKKCAANFIESCIKNCGTRGGQARFCPTYCEGQKAKLGC